MKSDKVNVECQAEQWKYWPEGHLGKAKIPSLFFERTEVRFFTSRGFFNLTD